MTQGARDPADMRILGLSGLEHDTSSALLTERGIEAAIEESKLVRSRRTSGIPRAAATFCLQQASIDWPELDYVALAARPVRAWARNAWLRIKRFPLAPVASVYYQTRGLGELSRHLNHFRILRTLTRLPRSRVLGIEHHLCHAAASFYASPFDKALILTLDERGDYCSGLVALGEGNRIRILRSLPFPNSLGWVYSQVTELIGFPQHDAEHKTQWLSMEEEPAFQEVFLEMFRSGSTPMPRLDLSYFNRGLAGDIAFSEKFYRKLSLNPERGSELDERSRKQLASSLQHVCGVVVSELAEWFRKQFPGIRHLCLGGGLFLNPLLVNAVEKSAGFEQLFVFPAAGNEGNALGAAWYVRHQMLGKPRMEPISHVYWGPRFSNEETKRVLDNCKTSYRWFDAEEPLLEETIRLLEAGKIVAWHQGAAEFGPRALGNRNLLALPWAPYVKDNLNDYIKHREAFRPFALAVPNEDASRYFECSALENFMTSMASVRREYCELVRDFLLPGNRARLHVVDRRANPSFWRLLKRVGEGGVAPLLVSTSFNLFGEPLVIRPREAVRTFYCSGIDALVIGRFLLRKA